MRRVSVTGSFRGRDAVETETFGPVGRAVCQDLILWSSGPGRPTIVPMPSVLIVDDDPNMRFLERMVLEAADARFEVVGEAPSGEDAIRHWRDLQPQVIVMDDRLPGMRGLDAARLILAEQPHQVIVLVTAQHDTATVAAAMALGVRGCLAKTDVRRLPGQLLRYST